MNNILAFLHSNTVHISCNILASGQADKEAVHNAPLKFDATSCSLTVGTDFRLGGGERESWNGDIMFQDGKQEILMVGLHPETNQIAVRNSVFDRGESLWGYRWVPANFPDKNSDGEREYTFEFTGTAFVVSCSNKVTFLSSAIDPGRFNLDISLNVSIIFLQNLPSTWSQTQ